MRAQKRVAVEGGGWAELDEGEQRFVGSVKLSL